MGGGGRGGPRVSPLGIDLARRGIVVLPSLISLLPRILASIILRSTTPDPSSENPSWNRTRVRSVYILLRNSLSDSALLADESLSGTEDERRDCRRYTVNCGFYESYCILESSRCASGAKLTVILHLRRRFVTTL